MTPCVGMRVSLRSGEDCEIRRCELTAKGLAVWFLVCVSGQWRGYLPLTTHEIQANV